MLPPTQPRLVVPLDSPRQLKRGLGLHRPGRRLGRWYLGLLSAASGLGLSFPLRRRILWIQGGGVPEFGAGAVLYLGSTHEARKTTILPERSGTILKLAETSVAIEDLHREAATLEELQDSPIHRQVPRLMGLEPLYQGWVLRQEFRPRVSSFRASDERSVVDFLVALSSIGRGRRPLEPDPTSPDRDLTVIGHRSHGDFAPWNVTRTRNGLFVFDWEASRRWAPALVDAFSWVVFPALRTQRRIDPCSIARRALEFAGMVASRAAIPEREVGITWRHWLRSHPARRRGNLLDHLHGLHRGG